MSKQERYCLLIGFVIAGCVSATYPYKYYNLDIPDGCYENGKLLAHDPKDDLPFSVCKPDPSNRMKCVHLQTAIFERMQIDLSNCQNDLIQCQKPH